MRFIWKLLLFVTTVWYALQWDCAQDGNTLVSDSICQHLQTANLHEQLEQLFPIYRDYVGPELYNRYQWALGHKRNWSVRYFKPAKDQLQDKLDNCGTCQKYKLIFMEHINYYYYGVLRPMMMDKIVKPYNLNDKWGKFCQLSQDTMTKGYNLLFEVYRDLRPAILNAKRQLLQLASVLKLQLVDKFELIKGSILEKTSNFTSEYNSKSPASSTVDDDGKPVTVLFDDIDGLDDEEDEDTEDEEFIKTVITSTVIEVVTIQSDSTTTGTATVIPNDIDIKSSNDIIIDEQSQIQNEFDNWSSTISDKVDSFIKLFDKEVTKSMKKLINNTETELLDEINNYTSNLERIFQDITKSIQDIDSLESIDPMTGEKSYFNKANSSKIDKFITREFVREFFQTIDENTNNISDKVQNKLNKLMKNVNDKVNYLRQDYSDLYEEWANVMVNEWSKKLVYADIVGGTGIHDDVFASNSTVSDEDADEENIVANRDSQSDLNWKKYLKIKKQVINARDNIIEHNVKLNKVENFIKKLENSLQNNFKKNGEFAYILRAKANLAFQQREKEEREMILAKETAEREAAEDFKKAENVHPVSPAPIEETSIEATPVETVLAKETPIVQSTVEDIVSTEETVNTKESLKSEDESPEDSEVNEEPDLGEEPEVSEAPIEETEEEVVTDDVEASLDDENIEINTESDSADDIETDIEYD